MGVLGERVRRRPAAARRGGSLDLTTGYVAVGLSAVALLAAGPRVLGVREFGGLGLAWTMVNVFGLGLAFPTEQLLGRRMNARRPVDPQWPLGALACCGLAFALVGWRLSRVGSGLSYQPMLWCIALGIGGWIVLAVVRSRLAGAGDLRAYGFVLLSESACRIGLVCLAYCGAWPGPETFGIAVGGPLIFSAAVGAVVRTHRRDSSSDASRRTGRLEQVWFVVVALGCQACLNAPPLILGLRGHVGAAEIGAFVAATTYFRAPTVLVGGVITHALVALSEAWGREDQVALYRLERRFERGLLAALLPAVGILSAGAPILLPLYYGHRLDLAVVVLAGLVASSVVASYALLLTQSLLAVGRSAAAARSWTIGALSTVVVLAISPTLGWLAAGGLAIGPCVVATCVAATLRRLRTAGPSRAPLAAL